MKLVAAMSLVTSGCTKFVALQAVVESAWLSVLDMTFFVHVMHM